MGERKVVSIRAENVCVDLPEEVVQTLKNVKEVALEKSSKTVKRIIGAPDVKDLLKQLIPDSTNVAGRLDQTDEKMTILDGVDHDNRWEFDILEGAENNILKSTAIRIFRS